MKSSRLRVMSSIEVKVKGNQDEAKEFSKCKYMKKNTCFSFITFREYIHEFVSPQNSFGLFELVI